MFLNRGNYIPMPITDADRGKKFEQFLKIIQSIGSRNQHKVLHYISSKIVYIPDLIKQQK